MDTTSTHIAAVSRLGHGEAMDLGAAEYSRLIELLDSLSDDEWATVVPDCPAWTVRDMATHVLGAMDAHASPRESIHQLWAARRRPEPQADAVAAVQVLERAELGPAEIVARMRRQAPRSIRTRRLLPAPLRGAVRLRIEMPWGRERWSLGYLMDTVYLRDTWMHRLDACRALNRAPTLDAGHDGRIVADVVADWAARHGQSFRLTVEGPAGGVFHSGSGGEEHRIDGVALARVLSGRDEGEGLLATIIPF